MASLFRNLTFDFTNLVRACSAARESQNYTFVSVGLQR